MSGNGDKQYRNQFIEMIKRELPYESFLELAIQYHQRDLFNEAAQVLALASPHPILLLWQAYMLNKADLQIESNEALEKALSSSSEFIFSFRAETLEVLNWANQRKAHWKWKYYEGLMRSQMKQDNVARRLFMECGEVPNFASFYLAKGELFKDEPKEVRSAFEKAYQLDPNSWRTGLKLAEFYVSENETEKALHVAEKNYSANPSNYTLGLQYIQILMLNKQYLNALNALYKLTMLPIENALEIPRLFRQVNILYAIENMKSMKWKTAIQYLKNAETWPENNGTEEPYKPDNRITQFMVAYCYIKLNNHVMADESFNYVEMYQNCDETHLNPLGDKLSNIAKQHGKNFKAIALTLSQNKVGDESEYLLEFLGIL